MPTPFEQLVIDDRVVLTTKDNPINPFDDFNAWYAEDHRLGHNTCERLARMSHDYADMSDLDESLDYARMLQEIFKYDVDDVYSLAFKTKNSDFV